MGVPFSLKDCVLSVIATGEAAQSLLQLRDVLKKIPINSIYYHFWGNRLSPSFHHPEHHNDFARWAHAHLHDCILTEQFGIIDPTEYSDLENLRNKLLEIIENRLDATDFILWEKGVDQFHFLRSTIIVFDLGMPLKHPVELKKVIPQMAPSSIFYHFIDARRRTLKKRDDFSVWLSSFKEEFDPLVNKIQHIDPYFLSLSEIKSKLIETVNEHFS